MIPIGDDNRGNRRAPLVVFALIAINIAVFLYQLQLGTEPGGALEQFIFRWGARPYELSHGADVPPTIGLPIWVTAVTSMFMHGGWLHILGNMLFLWVFGDNVENAMGRLRFLLFYLLCGLGAVALQVLVQQDSLTPMVGASGAISGVLAAYLVLFPGGTIRVLVFLGLFVTVIHLPALIVIGMWVVLQFLNGLATLGPETTQTDGVAYFAHLGGFLAGLLLVFVFRDRAMLARMRAARRWG